MSTFEYRPGPAIRVTRLNYLGLYRSTVSVIILLESQVSKEKGFSQTRLSKLPDIPRICQHLCNLPVRLHRYSRWYDRFGPMWSGACLSQALVGGAAFFPQTRPDYVRVKRLCGMSWEFIHKARRILVSALNIIMSSDQPLTRRVQRQRGAEQTNITYKVFHIKSPSIICIMIQPLRFSERLNEKKHFSLSNTFQTRLAGHVWLNGFKAHRPVHSVDATSRNRDRPWEPWRWRHVSAMKKMGKTGHKRLEFEGLQMCMIRKDIYISRYVNYTYNGCIGWRQR